MEQTFLACLAEHEDIEWLQSSLGQQGQVLRAPQNLDALLSLINATGSTLAFVSMDRSNLVAQCSLIESLLEACPLVAVVVVGDGYDNELVLAAMRAGARDFISYGQRSSEVLGLVRRLSERLPAPQNKKGTGKLQLIYGAQPDDDAAFVAAHLAILLQQSVNVLFVDLGLPNGLGLDLLGLEPSFSFDDAMRNLRRMDRSLIDNAFVKHTSGLHVLPIGELSVELASYNSSELFLLFSTLRNNFDMVVVNACGQQDCEALRTLVGVAEDFIWYTNTRVSSCRRNLALLERWRQAGIKLDHGSLLLDYYRPNIAPDSQSLRKAFGLPLRGLLPTSFNARLTAINQGRLLFSTAPNDPLCKELQSSLSVVKKAKQSLLQSLLARLKPAR